MSLMDQPGKVVKQMDIGVPSYTKQQGSRYNTGKNKLQLNSPYANEEVAKISTFGATKYDDFNWCKGLSFMETVGCLERHLTAFLKGEDKDPETGCLHIAHVAWNALALTHFQVTETGNDDRPWKAMDQRKTMDQRKQKDYGD